MDIDIVEKEVVTSYRVPHRFENQVNWAAPGIPLNPFLREGFDTTPFAQRSAKELADWLGKPYVVSTTLETVTWAEFVARVGKGQPCITKFEFNLKRMKAAQEWLKQYPTGIRFDVWCLTEEAQSVVLLGSAADVNTGINICRSWSAGYLNLS